ncbi:MAG: YbjN domain-containing protein [Veillonellaceae bacterium]|nr:YbjN domain-containing protein [Veillonellaceae bacterium]
MGRVYESVLAFLQEDNWRYEEIPGETAVRLSFTGQNARYDCFGRVNEAHEVFVFYSIIPVRVPEAQRPLVAELLARINYGLNIGNFELDMNDGEIRYKTSIDIEGGDLTPRMAETLIAVNISTTDRYFPSFADVMYAGVAPVEAVARIERPDPSSRN